MGSNLTYELVMSLGNTWQSNVAMTNDYISLSAPCVFMSTLSSVGITLGYGLDDRGYLGFDSRWGLGIFLFVTLSRTALGPTQPPLQLVPGALSLEVKRPGREADHSTPSSAEAKNAWSYTSTPPIYIHGVVLSQAQEQFYLYLTNSNAWRYSSIPPIRLHGLVLS
jgi:hypothetical protein